MTVNPSLAPTSYTITNPSTLERIADVSASSAADVDAAIECAGRAFPGWSRTPSAERAEVLARTAAALRAATDEIAALLTREQGKPVKEARIEVARCADTFDYYAGIDDLERSLSRDVTGKSARVVRRALGVCAAIVPWNFPLTLMANKIVPALASGNTVVVKPALTTPLAASRVIELLYANGLPEGAVGIVLGGAAIGAALVQHPLVRKVSFTGSTSTGKAIMGLAAEGLKRLTLELGGNDSMIVCDDADIAAAARAAAVGRFFNAGQACIATKRIYVQRSRFDQFVELASERARKLDVGDGFDSQVRMGPLHSEAQRRSVESFVQDAIARGARVTAGGGRPEAGPGYFFQPTVLIDVPDDAQLVRDECFGPVLPIFSFDTLDEAFERANATVFGLGSSIWTNDARVAERAVDELDAGYTWINDIATDYDAMPFGGVKQSGFGKERGVEVLDEYTSTKSVVAGGCRPDGPLPAG